MFSVSNLGYNIDETNKRAVYGPHYQNMIARQKSIDRSAMNGELVYKTRVNQERKIKPAKEKPLKDTGRARPVFVDSYEFGQPLYRNLNPNKFNPITNAPRKEHNDIHAAYMKFWNNQKQEMGMLMPTQDPAANWESKKYLKY